MSESCFFVDLNQDAIGLRKSEKFVPMRIVVLYNQVAATDSSGELDVLKQCVAVEESLRQLGHESLRLSCSLNLGPVRDALIRFKPDVVFNLAESLGGTDRLMPVVAVFLEALGLPFTGASSLAMLTTTSKLVAKQRLLDQEISTPAWLTLRGDDCWRGGHERRWNPDRAIIKAIAEHASLGLGDDSVVECGRHSTEKLRSLIAARAEQFGTPHFAEQFIDGREFNLSLLAGTDGADVLPPAEIEFIDFAAGKPRIVGHGAKWDESTMEYINTPRRFEFPLSDRALLDELEALARRCWTAFDLHGYARVDFRVDNDGQPWILEVNANPCLSPDAGFAAALQQAGLSFTDAVERIIADAVRCSRVG